MNRGIRGPSCELILRSLRRKCSLQGGSRRQNPPTRPGVWNISLQSDRGLPSPGPGVCQTRIPPRTDCPMFGSGFGVLELPRPVTELDPRHGLAGASFGSEAHCPARAPGRAPGRGDRGQLRSKTKLQTRKAPCGAQKHHVEQNEFELCCLGDTAAPNSKRGGAPNLLHVQTRHAISRRWTQTSAVASVRVPDRPDRDFGLDQGSEQNLTCLS